MRTTLLSALAAALVSPADQTAAHPQPSIANDQARVVHVSMRLVDLNRPPLGMQWRRSASEKPISFLSDEAVLRLQLAPDERLGLYSIGTTEEAVWFDPFVGDAAPEARQTPGWSLGAVWYNIFPERFDNANPTNDQGWPHGTPIPWQQPWEEVTADEFEASANRAIALPRRYGDDHQRRRPPLREVVFERRYGGDLEGVVRRLDHITRLGATAIWLCPVFDATSLHKYDAADYRHIDPHLAGSGPSLGPDLAPELAHEPVAQSVAADGRSAKTPWTADADEWSWTPADRVLIDRLLPGAHDRGLRVILDGVWNHVGLQHPAFVDVRSLGSASRYADWFDARFDTAGRLASWRAWDRRNGALPAFSQRGDTLTQGPRRHVFDITRRWMDPNGDGDPSDGIDGWRLDVANEVGLTFWSQWRALVREINPQAVLVGELWFDGGDYFGGRAFDSQMNYPLAFALTNWLGRDPGYTTERLVEDLDRVMRHHQATNLAQVNLLGSHDTPRLASMLANPGREYDRDAGLGAERFDRSQPQPQVYDMIELGYAVLTALPGSPMIYHGDELGMWGADDPENRKPLPWPDVLEPLGVSPPDDMGMSERMASWLRLRQDPTIGPVLRFGAASWRAQTGLLIIARQLDATRITLMANPSNQTRTLEGHTIGPRSVVMMASYDGTPPQQVHASRHAPKQGPETLR
ncbi:MAG: alpha-amylase family glycosyl hydrolase [Planctomycetota bacterium]